MSSTILMAIVLAVMWVVVLVPMIARRRDAARESRSVERFAGAMRGLGLRPSATNDETPDRGESVVGESDVGESDVGYCGRPAEPSDRDAVVASRAAARRRGEVHVDARDVAPTPVGRPMPASRAAMLRRRRRTLGTLTLLALAFLAAALLWRPVAWIAQCAFDAMLLGYLYWLRAEVRRERARRERRSMRSGGRTRPAARPALSHGSSRVRVRPSAPGSAGARTAAAAPDAAAAPIETAVTEPISLSALAAAAGEMGRNGGAGEAYLHDGDQFGPVAIDDDGVDLTYVVEPEYAEPRVANG